MLLRNDNLSKKFNQNKGKYYGGITCHCLTTNKLIKILLTVFYGALTLVRCMCICTCTFYSV